MQNQTDRPGPAQLHNSYPYGAARTQFCPREAALPEAEGSIPAGQHRGCQQDLCNSWKGTQELFHQSSKALQHQVGLHGEGGRPLLKLVTVWKVCGHINSSQDLPTRCFFPALQTMWEPGRDLAPTHLIARP